MSQPLCKAYEDALWMLEDGVRKMPVERWRSGYDDYLIPIRIAYHIIKGLEWLTNDLPREEFLKTRRYNLDWLGLVDSMPDQPALLEDLHWIRTRVMNWLSQGDAQNPEGQARVEKALYHLRHVQHHVGEYGVIARLVQFTEPEWK